MKHNFKFFGVGLSKTGTSSLHEAFQLLGFTSKHYLNEATFNHMLNNTPGYQYDFAVDMPINMKYKQLNNIYKYSKFILTIRNINDWITSCQTHWNNNTKDVNDWGKYKTENYGSVKFNETVFRQVYLNHINNVTNYFNPNQLLIMDIPNGDGWDKLCPFIGIDIPDIEFPHKNKTVVSK